MAFTRLHYPISSDDVLPAELAQKFADTYNAIPAPLTAQHGMTGGHTGWNADLLPILPMAVTMSRGPVDTAIVNNLQGAWLAGGGSNPYWHRVTKGVVGAPFVTYENRCRISPPGAPNAKNAYGAKVFVGYKGGTIYIDQIAPCVYRDGNGDPTDDWFASFGTDLNSPGVASNIDYIAVCWQGAAFRGGDYTKRISYHPIGNSYALDSFWMPVDANDFEAASEEQTRYAEGGHWRDGLHSELTLPVESALLHYGGGNVYTVVASTPGIVSAARVPASVGTVLVTLNGAKPMDSNPTTGHGTTAVCAWPQFQPTPHAALAFHDLRAGNNNDTTHVQFQMVTEAKVAVDGDVLVHIFGKTGY